MKKLLSIFLAIVLIITAMPLGAFEFKVSAATSGYYTYSVSSGKATITDVNNSISGNVTIPSTLGGYPVTSIGAEAFYLCHSLTSVTIPDSVTSIGDYAFYSCDSLTSITIGDSVTSIGSSAFSHCTSLTSVTIGDSVTSIGSYAFSSCDSLTSITIGDSVTSIGYRAFYKCTSLENVTLGNSVTSIGDYVFCKCSSLTSVTIGDSVTSIGYDAFLQCYSLKNVYITDTVAWCNISFFDSTSNPLYYGANLYLNGELVTDLIIPKSVTKIKSYAFLGCDSLKSIEVYNPNLSFNDNCGINYNHTIYGYVGSTAEAFAEEVGAEFIDIETVHTHTFSAATCTKPKTCVCGKTEGEALGHSYTAACDTDCNVCGEVRSASNHVYDNACDTECNECGMTRTVPDHVYDNACDAKCNVCFGERTVPEHNFNADRVCTECGKGEYVLGDVDGNEEITDADAEYLLMHTFFPEDYPINQDADFNGDGSITDADAEYLLMFTFFPEDYPLNTK